MEKIVNRKVMQIYRFGHNRELFLDKNKKITHYHLN